MRMPRHLLSRFGVLEGSAERYRKMQDDGEPEPVEGRIYVEGILTSYAEELRYWGEKATNAAMVREQLQAQSGSGDLEVWLNSPGGDVTEASAITAELRDYGSFMCVVTGMCASAATFVQLAAERTEMFQTAEFLIHMPRVCMCGTAAELRAEAGNLDTIGEDVAGIYAEKTGMEVKDVLALMEEDRYMGSKEAMERGFVDEVRPIIPQSAKKGNGKDMSAQGRLSRVLRASARGIF